MNAAIALDKNGISIHGSREILLCASLFYFRIPKELWRDRIKKLRQSGYNCADVYFPWNYHEGEAGRCSFSEDRDIAAFLQMMVEEGIYVIARPGPYICSEWDGGSIPARFLADGTLIRTDDAKWMTAVEQWYAQVVPIIASYQIGHGGSVILLQIENELDFFDCPNPAAYMGKLAEIVRRLGIDVPVFGCAGQCSAEGATGFAPGVVPTYNFYPSSFDPAFDPLCFAMHKALQEKNLPLMITETGREHFLLRREMANGARLLGAYNQVAGTNFGYTASTNNWGRGGNPLSFITTDYDFASMIDAKGRFREEAFEGRLLGGLLDTMGDALASCTVHQTHNLKVVWQNKNEKNGQGNLLNMGDFGMFISLSNYSENTETVAVETKEGMFLAEIDPLHAPFFPINVLLEKTDSCIRLLHGSVEILHMEKGLLYLYADGSPEALFGTEDGMMQKIKGFGDFTISLDHQEICVKVLRRSEAQTMDIGRGYLEKAENSEPMTLPLETAVKAEMVPEKSWMQAVTGNSGITLEACGFKNGCISYEVATMSGCGILLEGAADIVQAWEGGKVHETRVSAGQWQEYGAVLASDRASFPNAAVVSDVAIVSDAAAVLNITTVLDAATVLDTTTGLDVAIVLDAAAVLDTTTVLDAAIVLDAETVLATYPAADGLSAWRFRIDSWGHSNFDDARYPSMRIAAPKGTKAIYQIDQKESPVLWRMKVHETWLPKELSVVVGAMDPILMPNVWNSTRMPLVASYTLDWTLQEESDTCALHMAGAEAETAVYVDGLLAGTMNALDPWFSLSAWFKPRQKHQISLLVRKRHWAEPAGIPVFYHLTMLSPEMCGSNGDEMLAYMENQVLSKNSGLEILENGIAFEAGKAYGVAISFDAVPPACYYARFKSCGLKLSGIFNGHLLGRVFGECKSRPDMVGGDPEVLYLPKPWFREKDNRLILMVEALEENARLAAVYLEE